MLTNFAIQASSTYRGLFLWLAPSAYLPQVLLRPALMVVLFALAGRYAADEAAAQHLAVGRIAYSIYWVHIASLTQSFYFERIGGTAPLLFASSANRAVNFLARGLPHYANGPLVAASALVGAWLVTPFDAVAVGWPAVVVTVLVLSAASVGFGLCAGAIAFAVRSYQSAYQAIAGLVLALTGSVIPVDALPGPLAVLATALPLTHGVGALRAAFEGAPLPDIAPLLAAELAIGVAYGLAGYALFRWVEAAARRSGTLDRAAA